MDSHSHQANLNTLSKLYGLVQNNEPDGQSLVTKILDEDSSIFLKKLLDVAADRIFEAHVLDALCTNNLEQSKDPLEVTIRNLTSPNKAKHKEVLEEKTSTVELPREVYDAIERIESLLPELERLSKPYSGNRKQYGTSQRRTTSNSSFDSTSYNGDDELSPSECSQSRPRLVGHRKMGELNRLNENLGSISHHHYHHHHSGEKSVEASGSLWKKYGKMLKSKEKRVEAEIGKKYMDMKMKKAEIKNQNRPTTNKTVKHEQRSKQQDGHFEELLGGLMRNLRNSNKLKKEVKSKNCINLTPKPHVKEHKLKTFVKTNSGKQKIKGKGSHLKG